MALCRQTFPCLEKNIGKYMVCLQLLKYLYSILLFDQQRPHHKNIHRTRVSDAVFQDVLVYGTGFSCQAVYGTLNVDTDHQNSKTSLWKSNVTPPLENVGHNFSAEFTSDVGPQVSTATLLSPISLAQPFILENSFGKSGRPNFRSGCISGRMLASSNLDESLSLVRWKQFSITSWGCPRTIRSGQKEIGSLRFVFFWKYSLS